MYGNYKEGHSNEIRNKEKMENRKETRARARQQKETNINKALI